MEPPRRLVVVTGFGPFGEHAVNASWIAVQVLPLLPLWLLGATEHSGNGTRVSKGTSQLPRSRELSCLNKSASRTTMGKWSKHLLFEGTHFQEAGLISHAPLKYWRRDTGQIHLKEETSGERICPLDTREAAQDLFIQELKKLGLGEGVDLHVYEIPVEYQTVQRLIPALWKEHCPQLVVHVGVSGMATTVTLEKCGHNVGYKGLDNCRFCPGSQCCVEGGPECIDSIIDMDAVCKRVSTLGLDVTVTISKDAGRYLCDFTYYTSLYQSHGRSAFVHVPPLGKPYTAEQLGRALQAIIEEMLDVLEHSEGKINCRHEH